MTQITDQQQTVPDNLLTDRFSFQIQRIPDLNWKVQAVNLPGVSVGRVDQPNPVHGIPLICDRGFFADLSISFIVDEELKNWRLLREWMLKLTNHDTDYKYEDLLKALDGSGQKRYSDLSLQVRSSANKPNWRVHFEDAFPISLSDIVFDTQDMSATTAKAQVVMTYRSYKFVDV